MRSTSHNGGIWITSYFRLLSVAILGGASSQRPQRDVPVVGIGPLAPVAGTVRRSSAFSGVSYQSATGVAIEDELIRGLETDDQVTVVAPVEFGELLCDTLAMAEDALSLSFVLLDDETIVAAKSSYTVANGSTFTDGVGRKVWTGIVTDPPQADDEAVPRTVSMAWGDVCDTETFLLKVTKRSSNGKTRVTKTVPCDGSTTHTCLVEVVLDFNEPGDPIVPDEANAAGDAISGASGSGNSTDPNGASGSSPGEENHPAASSPHERRLHDSGNTVIDVMVLYSVASLVTMGVITPAQMETIILEGLVGTNEAFVNSEVSVYFNPVHIGQLPFEDTPVKSGDMLFELQQNEEVRGLRDSTGADLVQMIGYFTDDFCGLGYFYFDEAYGFSVVRAACIDNYTHTHEFGHNLGCYHNREDSEYDNDYAHGLRYCEGAQPYRTLMSYSCGNPRVNYFSNPDVTLRGRPTGRLTEDNARAIEDNMVAVSNFRKRPTTATPLAPTPTISLPTIAPHTGVPPATVSPTTTPPATTPSTTATPPAAHVSAAIPTPTSTTVPPATPLQVITPISIPATTPAETPNDAATPAIIPATALGFRGRQSS